MCPLQIVCILEKDKKENLLTFGNFFFMIIKCLELCLKFILKMMSGFKPFPTYNKSAKNIIKIYEKSLEMKI